MTAAVAFALQGGCADLQAFDVGFNAYIPTLDVNLDKGHAGGALLGDGDTVVIAVFNDTGLAHRHFAQRRSVSLLQLLHV